MMLILINKQPGIEIDAVTVNKSMTEYCHFNMGENLYGKSGHLSNSLFWST